MVYSCPKNMGYMRDHNVRDTNVNFDIVEEPVSKWGIGRVGGRKGERGRGRGQANDRGRGRGRTRGITRGATRGTGQGLRGQGGINMKQVLSNAHKTRINEEERERVQNVLSVLSPKQLEVGNTTGPCLRLQAMQDITAACVKHHSVMMMMMGW